MRTTLASALGAAALALLVSTPAAARGTPMADGSLTTAPIATAALGADFIDIDISGWRTFGGFGRAGNSSALVDVGAGTVVTGFDWINLSFTASGASTPIEFTLSVNRNIPPPSDTEGFIDWSPSTSNLAAGSYGPGSGSWGGGVGVPGNFGAGAAFAVDDGLMFVTVYESFDDPFGDTGLVLDATVATGTLRVFLAPIPEPGTYGLMALGLLAVGAAVRKRQAAH